MGQAKKCYKLHIRQGKRQQANCLETIVVHGIWNNARAHKDEDQKECKRCGKGKEETLKHRYYECEANERIDSDDVKQTKFLCRIAGGSKWEEWGSCYWNGGMLPADMRAESPKHISEDEATRSADDREDADFVHDMENTGMVATDGSGGKNGEKKRKTQLGRSGSCGSHIQQLRATDKRKSNNVKRTREANGTKS